MTASSKSYDIPDDRYYDRLEHMWAMPGESENRIAVGIDSLGLESLGELAYIALQPVGTSVQRGESLGTLEAAKMTGDLIAPVSGTLVARNEDAVRDPAIVNDDPYGAGWLVELAPRDWESESGDLVAGDSIPGWVEAEVARYRAQGWID